MGGLSIWHWMIVLLVVLLLFGTGKVSSLMGEVATGMKTFKKNMKDDEDAPMETTVDRPSGAIAPPTAPGPVTTIRERGNVQKA